MNILQSIILGIIEGLTEFLPISSTFHLIWASKIMHIPSSEFVKTFEVFIQSGAILAVTILYFKEIIRNSKLIKNLIISFIPTTFVGFILYNPIKNIFFENYISQILVFLFVGLIFIFYEKIFKTKLSKSLEEITIKDAILIGISQALAVFPGVSRAGAVILGMMILGFTRTESAKYSFMLAIPTIIAAGILDIFKFNIFSLSLPQVSNLGIGFVTAFISALFVVKWFIRYLQTKSLENFGWYRIIVSVLLLSFLWI